MKKITEIEMYPLSSFVSDVGGALGLFVGFSFIGLWDVIEILLKKLIENISNQI